MKTMTQLRTTLNFIPHELNSHLKFFIKNKIDWEVYLPTKGIYLQRNFVWTLDQKREIIWSILMRRNIPRMAIMCAADDTYLIIDGKQRLSSMFGFFNNDFTLLIDDKEYYFNELPIDYQKVIAMYSLSFYIVYENSEELTDQDKIDWFKFINFAGTPQDAEHMKKLK